eukprot:scaffold8467_cov64-Phaeocystis_antarctica.AAC.2
MSLAARLRCFRRSFLRHRSHVRARRWSWRAAATNRALVRSPSIPTRSAALGSSDFALAGLRALISAALSESRLARVRATTSGDAVTPRLSRTLVSIALVASARADCRSSTAFASATANASAVARASSLAFSSVAPRSFWRRRLSPDCTHVRTGLLLDRHPPDPPEKQPEDASTRKERWAVPTQNSAKGIPRGWTG